MKNPGEVIKDFCWEYDLQEIRGFLKEWYTASLADENADNRNIFITYVAIEKIVDALFMLNKRVAISQT